MGKNKSLFLEKLAENASETRTLNGAKTWSTTSDACLDLFSVAGGMRYRSPEAQIRLFDRAYIENPELAMKLLFYIRDIREGMGERQLFRTLIRHVAKTWPDSARKNVHLIPEFGRYDDMLCLMGTKAEREVIDVIKGQMEADLAAIEACKNGNSDAKVSLLGKWLPSINTSSARTRGIARKLAPALGMSERDYRRTLTALRRSGSVTEQLLSSRKLDEVKYSTVPAGAMLKYRRAFCRKDGRRFSDYLGKVADGTEKIHSATLFPYEIVRPMMGSYRMCQKAEGEQVLETLWKGLPKDFGNDNAISVIDTSGSMYWRMGQNAVTPALISQSLGLYHAERCRGRFHNCFISFESSPHLIKIHGDTLRDRIRYIQTAPWGGSTNLEAVFELILKTAIDAHVPQEELPTVLYIISDMEFNFAVRNPSKTVYENARELFEYYGYTLPAVVFINVNSWQMQAPVRKDQKGAALASGMGTATFKKKFDGNMTPMSHMLDVLMSERYKDIHA